jgi:hypothetical protein
MGADPVVEEARYVLGWLQRNPTVNLSKRDLYQGVRSRFKRAEDLEPALRMLVAHGYLRDLPQERRQGRPSPRYLVSPYTQNPQNPQNPQKPEVEELFEDIELFEERSASEATASSEWQDEVRETPSEEPEELL